jgi:nitrogen-specific signal transduction histidine kinase
MLITLLTNIGEPWAQILAREAQDRSLVLRAGDLPRALDLLWSLPVSVLAVSLDPLARTALEQYQRLRQAAPLAVAVCLIAPAALEQVRVEDLAEADFWLSTEAGPDQVRQTVVGALALAAVRAEAATLESGGSPPSPGSGPESVSAEVTLFRRLMPALSSGFDTDRLLQTYVESLAQFVRCATYCLLWRPPGEERFTVYAAQGLPAELVGEGRLRADDGLPRWYLHNTRVLTRAELPQWPDRGLAAAVAREMDTFRGKVAVPLLMEGRLAGLLLLGEKVTGAPYAGLELETLFALSNYVALQVQSFALHAEISRSRAYMERILSGMSSGVITLGRDGKIAVCNPYAASIVGTRPEDLEGQDLRALPSPLGDYLYAAFLEPADAVSGQEVSIRGGALTLRLSTSQLADEHGEPLGSVLLLEDMTGQIALLTERHRRERLDMLTQVVSSIAHEVRTPLTAVKTYAELAAARDADEDLRGFWQETVTPQIDRLNALITQLVELVQQPEPDFELVRLDEVLRGAIERLCPEAEKEPLVEVEVSRPLPRVIADPAHTQQALVYLLHYLRGDDASPVQVRLYGECTDSGETVVLTMERLKRSAREVAPESLFDPLQALREAQGGLGPAISRMIIENQGGALQAGVEDGRLGFRVFFPAPTLTTTPAPAPAPRPAPSPRREEGVSSAP